MAGTGYIKELDISGFMRVSRELSAMSGIPMESVIVHQVGMLMKACIRRTPVRTKGAIIKRMSKRGGRVEFASGRVIQLMKAHRGAESAVMFLDDSTFRPKRGRKAPRVENGKTWHDMSKRHWSNKRWARFQAHNTMARKHRQNMLKETMAARGLAKQTWFRVMQDLGLGTGDIPAYVRNARGPGGKEYDEGFAKMVIEEAGQFVEMTITNPLLIGKLNWHRIFQGAINDRVKAFEIEMEKGVFDTIKTRAQRYPGIFVE